MAKSKEKIFQVTFIRRPDGVFDGNIKMVGFSNMEAVGLLEAIKQDIVTASKKKAKALIKKRKQKL